MTDSKKKRMSMLDSLAAMAGTQSAPSSMMSSNRALRSARDAVDAHHVWELDPERNRRRKIFRQAGSGDVHDLRALIELNGQTVPILVAIRN